MSDLNREHHLAPASGFDAQKTARDSRPLDRDPIRHVRRDADEQPLRFCGVCSNPTSAGSVVVAGETGLFPDSHRPAGLKTKNPDLSFPRVLGNHYVFLSK
jgi:hypothetical protein